jgi:putative oligomerization/nucleic acid binding protein
MRLGRRQRPNLLGAAARTAVIAGTASAVTGAVRKRRHNHHAEPQGITDDQLSKLERLADLRKAGVLSDEELETEKAKILGPADAPA